MQLDLAAGEPEVLEGVIQGGFMHLHREQAVAGRLRPRGMGGELLAARQAIAGNQAVLRRFQVDRGWVEMKLLEWRDQFVLKFRFGFFDPLGNLRVERACGPVDDFAFDFLLGGRRLLLVLVAGNDAGDDVEQRNAVEIGLKIIELVLGCRFGFGLVHADALAVDREQLASPIGGGPLLIERRRAGCGRGGRRYFTFRFQPHPPAPAVGEQDQAQPRAGFALPFHAGT